MVRDIRSHFGTRPGFNYVKAMLALPHFGQPKAFPFSEVVNSLFIGSGHAPSSSSAVIS